MNKDGRLYDIITGINFLAFTVNKHLKFKCLRYVVYCIFRSVLKWKVISLLYSNTTEQILFEFARFTKTFNLTAGKFQHLKNVYCKDEEDFGIDYKVIVSNQDVVTGIDMVIWTKDRMAKLNLELSIKFGEFTLVSTWFIKNKDGFFERYSRSDILKLQPEMKEILVEYITKYCLIFYDFSQETSPSR